MVTQRSRAAMPGAHPKPGPSPSPHPHPEQGLTFEGLCLVFAIGVVLIFACRRRRAQPST